MKNQFIAITIVFLSILSINAQSKNTIINLVNIFNDSDDGKKYYFFEVYPKGDVSEGYFENITIKSKKYYTKYGMYYKTPLDVAKKYIDISNLDNLILYSNNQNSKRLGKLKLINITTSNNDVMGDINHYALFELETKPFIPGESFLYCISAMSEKEIQQINVTERSNFNLSNIFNSQYLIHKFDYIKKENIALKKIINAFNSDFLIFSYNSSYPVRNISYIFQKRNGIEEELWSNVEKGTDLLIYEIKLLPIQKNGKPIFIATLGLHETSVIYQNVLFYYENNRYVYRGDGKLLL